MISSGAVRSTVSFEWFTFTKVKESHYFVFASSQKEAAPDRVPSKAKILWSAVAALWELKEDMREEAESCEWWTPVRCGFKKCQWNCFLEVPVWQSRWNLVHAWLWEVVTSVSWVKARGWRGKDKRQKMKGTAPQAGVLSMRPQGECVGREKTLADLVCWALSFSPFWHKQTKFSHLDLLRYLSFSCFSSR